MRSVNKRLVLRWAVTVGAACWLATTAYAQSAFSPAAFTPEAFTIDTAVAYALAQNTSMAQARASVAGKQQDVVAAQRMSWPTLKAELTALRGKGEPTSFSAVAGQQDPDTPTSKEISGNYGLSTLVLSTPIFQNGAFFFGRSPLENMASGALGKAQSDADAQAVELANQIAKFYLNTLSASEQVSLQQDAVEKLQHRLEGVHERVRSGLDTRADELNAQAALAAKNADLNAAKRLSALNRMQLALALGQNAQAQVEMMPVADNFPDTPRIEDTLASTLETQPALRSQMANWNVAKATLESQRAERLPRVVFDISRTEAGDFYTTGTNRFISAGVKLSMPLIDFGVSAKVRARNFEVAENEQKTLQLRSTLIQNAYQAYYAYQDAVDMFEAGKTVLAKAELQEQESAARYKKRLASLDSLLQDETATVTVRVNQVKLRYQAWSAWADFIKALGRPYTSALVIAAQ